MVRISSCSKRIVVRDASAHTDVTNYDVTSLVAEASEKAATFLRYNELRFSEVTGTFNHDDGDGVREHARGATLPGVHNSHGPNGDDSNDPVSTRRNTRYPNSSGRNSRVGPQRKLKR